MSGRLRFIATITGLVVGFWILEAAVEATFFSAHGYIGELLAPDAHEIYIRGMGCAVIIAAAVFWRLAMGRRDRMSRELQASENLYRDVVENCPESIIVHRGEQILYLNRMAKDYLGVDEPAELAGQSIDSFIHPEDRLFARERRSRTINGGLVPGGVAIRMVLPDGSVRTAEVNSVRIMFDDAPAVLTFCRDVTEDQATRKRLAASQERLSLALDAARDGVWDWDMVTDSLVYNQAWAQMLGLEPQLGDQSRQTWSNLVHPDDKARALDAATAHIEGEHPVFEAEVRLRHASGRYIWVLDRGKVVERAADGTPLRMTGTHRNITARKEAELALELRNRIAETFLTSPPDDVFGRVLALISDALDSPAGLLVTLEPAGMVRIATHDRVRGHDGEQQTGRDSLPATWREILESGQGRCLDADPEVPHFERRIDHAIIVPVLSQGRSLGLLAVADRDVSYDDADVAALGSLAGYLAPVLDFHLASKTKEGQLRQAQKMEAIGALAEGIAHDFNNILQAVLGFSTLALEEAQAMAGEEGSFIANDLERVVKATQRGRELVNRILLFSRRQEQERQPVDIAGIVEEAVELLTNAIPASIRISTRLDPACGPVLADPGQLSLMLMNLATNGFHAMEISGGVLTFRTRSVTAASDTDVPERLQGRDLVHITVGDTGCGMDETILTRLYDPFFTTKDVGKGTGLGLSVVHGIVAAHGGEIVIESAVGRGTAAHVYLPVHEPSAAPETDTPQAGGEAQAHVRRGSRILFLDDETDIGVLGKALLEKQGHHVLAVDDARVALEHLRRSPQEFDLLITDLTMPHMTGEQIAAAVQDIRPDLPILLITGLKDVPTATWTAHPQIRGVLRKPFGGDTLRETVGKVLRESGSRAAGPDPGTPGRTLDQP